MLAVWFALGAVSNAHPVAQGAVEVVIHEDRLEVRVRASNEEAFVAEAFGSSNETGGGLPAVWQRHGAYLLAHLHLQAAGQPLTGQLVRIQPPADPRSTTLTQYELTYPLPPASRRPATVRLRQDVLNEFEFAPGNQWEATYVATIGQETQPARAGLLWTAREPLEFTCDWQAAPAQSAPVRLEKSALFAAYLKHGVLHILSGPDHMLFMVSLVLAVVSLGDLVKVVTAFTVAHTLTITLSVLDVVRVPERVVQPLIAATIVFVAVQNIFWPRQTRGWKRLAVAFGFGLFHGLGFAGGLLGAMAGLPGLAVTTAIAAFSLGVELGHQAVVLPIFSGLRMAESVLPPQAGKNAVQHFALRYGSGVVAVLGCVYFLAALRTP